MKEPETLHEILTQWLEYIDCLLIRDEVPISDRPFSALVRFVEEAVVDIQGGPQNSYTKDNYIRQPWFHRLHRDVIEWYQQRYGARARPDPARDFASGVVLLFGSAFKLRIPLHREWPDGTGKKWVEMPGELRPGEDPFTQIQDPPNLEVLTAEEKRWLRKNVVQVVRLTRSLRVDLMFVRPRPDEFQGCADAIRPYFERAVHGVVEGSAGSLRTAMWDLQFAAELAFKAFLAQRGASLPLKHNLQKLYETAVAAGLPKLPGRLVSALPPAAPSIDNRYGQGPPPSLADAVARYRLVLLVARHCTKNLKRVVSGGRNPAFLLRSLVADPETDSQAPS